MIRIHNLRRKHRKYLLFKIFLHIFFFLLLQIFDIQSAHTVRLKLFLDLRIGLISLFIQRRHRPVDRVKLLFRSHAGADIQLPVVHRGHIIQTAHPDHKKLIQVAGEYSDKLHPFHKRNALVPCLLQNSLIEPEP